MAQEYTVSGAKLAVDQEGNPKIYNSPYGPLETWNVWFEGQKDKKPYQWQRKEGSEVNKGDVVYGNASIVERGGYKFPTFKSEQRPLGQLPSVSKDDDEKQDYIIEMLENIERKLGIRDTILEDIDESPIDLSDIPF